LLKGTFHDEWDWTKQGPVGRVRKNKQGKRREIQERSGRQQRAGEKRSKGELNLLEKPSYVFEEEGGKEVFRGGRR